MLLKKWQSVVQSYIFYLGGLLFYNTNCRSWYFTLIGIPPMDHRIVSVLFSLPSKGSQNKKNKQDMDNSKNLKTYYQSPM